MHHQENTHSDETSTSKLIFKWVDYIDENCENLDYYEGIKKKSAEMKIDLRSLAPQVKEGLKFRIRNKNPDLSPNEIDLCVEERYQYLWGDKILPKKRRLIREWVDYIDENCEILDRFESLNEKAKLIGVDAGRTLPCRVRDRLSERIRFLEPQLSPQLLKQRVEERFSYIWGDKVLPKQRRLINEWVDFIDENCDHLTDITAINEKASEFGIDAEQTMSKRVKQRLREALSLKPNPPSQEELEKAIQDRFYYIWGNRVRPNRRRATDSWVDKIDEHCEDLNDIPSLNSMRDEKGKFPPISHIKERLKERILQKYPEIKSEQVTAEAEMRYQYIWGDSISPKKRRIIREWVDQIDENCEDLDEIQSIKNKAAEIGVEASHTLSPRVKLMLMERIQANNPRMKREDVANLAQSRFTYIWGQFPPKKRKLLHHTIYSINENRDNLEEIPRLATLRNDLGIKTRNTLRRQIITTLTYIIKEQNPGMESQEALQQARARMKYIWGKKNSPKRRIEFAKKLYLISRDQSRDSKVSIINCTNDWKQEIGNWYELQITLIERGDGQKIYSSTELANQIGLNLNYIIRIGKQELKKRFGEKLGKEKYNVLAQCQQENARLGQLNHTILEKIFQTGYNDIGKRYPEWQPMLREMSLKQMERCDLLIKDPCKGGLLASCLEMQINPEMPIELNLFPTSFKEKIGLTEQEANKIKALIIDFGTYLSPKELAEKWVKYGDYGNNLLLLLNTGYWPYNSELVYTNPSFPNSIIMPAEMGARLFQFAPPYRKMISEICELTRKRDLRGLERYINAINNTKDLAKSDFHASVRKVVDAATRMREMC